MNISASFILWATVFGLLGFIFYSTLMMGLGTLVPYLRQLSRVTQYLMFPVMAPTIFAPILAEDPNGAFAIILSFFPLTAPTAVTLRLLFANVPIWQLLLSCLVMVVSTVVGINLISRYYQPYHLLYQPHVKIIDDLRSLVKRLSFRRKPESLRGMD